MLPPTALVRIRSDASNIGTGTTCIATTNDAHDRQVTDADRGADAGRASADGSQMAATSFAYRRRSCRYGHELLRSLRADCRATRRDGQPPDGTAATASALSGVAGAHEIPTKAATSFLSTATNSGGAVTHSNR